MHNEKNKKSADPVPEAEVLRAAKEGMPRVKNSTIANGAEKQNINNRERGVQYGADTTENMTNKNVSKKGSFSSDPSEMRKAPGYNGSVPGVNTPDIRLPGAEMKQDVSVPAFNPPVPNRAWTAMKMGMDIEQLSEEEKRDLYVGRDRFF
ncbi:MAG: hypothetical protein E7673_01450 [Ruminococcaceae bacterium]|nr:hypothetical protein [Oscillospiraceae bacterium]